MDLTRHTGAVALVTGAASGIGLATALRLAGEGAQVIATDGNREGLAALSHRCTSITTIRGDLRDQSFITDVVARAETIGPIRILANVAGIMDHFLPAGDVSDQIWEDVFAVNLTAPMRLCRAVLPLMSDRGGSIVNVGSVASLGGSGAGVAYHCSKHAIIGLTKHIAFTYGPRGVRCNVVCPGAVDTNIGTTAEPFVDWAFERQQTSIALAERTAMPDEIATAISWLASDEAANVNGAVLATDGGWKAA